MKRLSVATVAALAIWATGGMSVNVSASSDDERGPAYLALGDSGPFGYITQAGFEYVNPNNFVGHPDYIGLALRVDDVNASCPGETTGSFISTAEPDNGCRSFRANAPLHVPYGSTQLQFATSFLRSHRNTRAVTIMLGANDLFLVEAQCGGITSTACIAAALPAALGRINVNMRFIIAALRATGYDGAIVVTNYYSTDYTDPTFTQFTALLNQALANAAHAEGALVADVFTAFKGIASNPFAAGQTCRAGLLKAKPDPAKQFQCDDHPSQSGHQLIAQTIVGTLRAADRN